MILLQGFVLERNLYLKKFLVTQNRTFKVHVYAFKEWCFKQIYETRKVEALLRPIFEGLVLN